MVLYGGPTNYGTMTATATVDKHNWDCPCIDTAEHIESTLGQPLELPESIDTGAWVSDAEESLLAFFKEKTGMDYVHQTRDNTYNSEQDLSSQFVFSIFAPEDCSDWCWSDDVFVVIETHLGGDVRGNYSDFKVYRVDHIGDTGFFDWVCGWYAQPISDRYSHDELEDVNSRLSVGYSSNPTSELRDLLEAKTEPAWSDKHGAFVGRLAGIEFPLLLSLAAS